MVYCGAHGGVLQSSDAIIISHQQVACDESNNSSNATVEQDFNATRCLFCHAKSADFDANISHMLRTHSFLVPEQHRLQVDMTTLITYLDLVVSEYSQCLYCMTQRGSSEAARQHMMGKGHCNIDIASQDSEFREFYDFDLHIVGEQKGRSGSLAVQEASPRLFRHVNESSHLLHSGAKTSSLVTRSRRHHTHRDLSSYTTALNPTNKSPRSAKTPIVPAHDQRLSRLNRTEKQALTLTTQLDRLRPSDRSSLMHLTSAQQRAQLSTQSKQIDEARRAQRAMEAHVARKGNRTLMKHYSPDTTARPNG